MNGQLALRFLGVDAAHQRQVVASQSIDHVGMKSGIGVDPESLLVSGGERVAGHLAAGQIDLLVSVYAKHAVAAALQLAKRRFARRLDMVRDRHQDGTLAGRTGCEGRRRGCLVSW